MYITGYSRASGIAANQLSHTLICTCLWHHQPFKSSATGRISITNQLQLQSNRNSHILYVSWLLSAISLILPPVWLFLPIVMYFW